MIPGELILAIDFDGTITTNPDLSEHELVLHPNCAEVLERFYDSGIILILWTARSGKALDEAMKFLDDQGLLQLFDTVNEQLPELKQKYYPHISNKIGADVYIDDKNIGASYIKWDEVNKRTYVDWKEIEYIIYGD